jgi:transposase
MRRVHLRGHDNIRKRLLVHAGGLNLGLLMRTLFGVGTPRGLQGRAAALFAAFWSLLRHPATAFTLIWSRHESPIVLIDLQRPRNVRGITVTLKNAFATGC